MRIALRIPDRLLGADVDLGQVHVTGAMIQAYAEAVGDEAVIAAGCQVAPPTFCLTLRRGFVPELRLPPGTFGVFGGHDLELHEPLRAEQTYRIRARLTDVFEKSGRSGSMTVVVREAAIERLDGTLTTRIVERQVVRRIPAAVV